MPDVATQKPFGHPAFMRSGRLRPLFMLTLFGLGMSSRVARADLAPGDPADLLEQSVYAAGLSELTDFRFLPDGTLVMTLKNGRVALRMPDGTISTAGEFVVDEESEKGLLGVEVHPDFAQNRTLFFYYSSAASDASDLDRHRVVSITLDAQGKLAFLTEKILVRNLRGPANHDGGALAISADKKTLYIGVGDSGNNSNAPPGGTITNYFGTCLTNANGKILRIYFDGTIPADNPFADGRQVTACGDNPMNPISSATGAARKEIYAWGFRNPWRIWVDPVTTLLWVADVGEITYEEIGLVHKGRHHGWPQREGAHGYPRSSCQQGTVSGGVAYSMIPGDECIEPLYDCKHDATDQCKSITGGQIIDGCRWPAAFRGRYVFGDNVNGSMWSLQATPTRDGLVAPSRKDFASGMSPTSIRQGPDEALYVASFLSGRILRIAPKTPEVCAPLPDGGNMNRGPGDSGDPDGSTDAEANGGRAAEGDGGCGCSAVGGNSLLRPWLLALGLTVPFLRRRRHPRP